MILRTRESTQDDLILYGEGIKMIRVINFSKPNPLYKIQIMYKYIQLSDILKRTLLTKTQLKPQLFASSSQSTTTKPKIDPRVSYSNLSLIINNINKFEEFYAELCKILKKKKEQSVSNKYLLFVMIAEFLNVGKIVGGGKLKKIIMDNIAIMPDIDVQSKINKQTVHIRLRNNCSDHVQLKKWEQLLNQFTPNPTIPSLFNLTQPQYSHLAHQNPSIRSTSACVVQSFSSNLPPYLLFHGLFDKEGNRNKKFNVIDTCSAPGNKTIQLAEYLGDRGTVFAFQKDQRRYNSLQKNVEKFGADNVQCFNCDFLKTEPQDYNNVKLMMVDPSCSGSGMLVNFTRDNPTNQSHTPQSQQFSQFVQQSYSQLTNEQKQRIESLKKFQLQLLNHASKFKPQRLSYSTCSIYCQQNQEVVKQFLQMNPQYYVKPLFKNLVSYQSMRRGFGSIGRQCIRVDPRLKVSDGFFVVIFAKKKQNKKVGVQEE